MSVCFTLDFHAGITVAVTVGVRVEVWVTVVLGVGRDKQPHAVEMEVQA